MSRVSDRINFHFFGEQKDRAYKRRQAERDKMKEKEEVRRRIRPFGEGKIRKNHMPNHLSLILCDPLSSLYHRFALSSSESSE